MCPDEEPLELLAAAVLPPLEEVDAEVPLLLVTGVVAPELELAVEEELEEEALVERVEVEALPPLLEPIDRLAAGDVPEHPSAPAVRRIEIRAGRFMPPT